MFSNLRPLFSPKRAFVISATHVVEMGYLQEHFLQHYPIPWDVYCGLSHIKVERYEANGKGIIFCRKRKEDSSENDLKLGWT